MYHLLLFLGVSTTKWEPEGFKYVFTSFANQNLTLVVNVQGCSDFLLVDIK